MRTLYYLFLLVVLGLCPRESYSKPDERSGALAIIELEMVVRADGSVDEEELKRIELAARKLASVQRNAPILIHDPSNTPFDLVVRIFRLCKKLELRIDEIELHEQKPKTSRPAVSE